MCLIIAYCRNPVDDSWYHFDDQKVTKVANENDVITNNAYLLFYEVTEDRLHG